MRFGRGNLRRGNLIVKTLILPHFSRLPRQTEVVTRCEKTLILPHFSRLPRSEEVVTHEVTILERCLSNYIITRYHQIADTRKVFYLYICMYIYRKLR